MTKKFTLRLQKSVLGRSVSHYFFTATISIYQLINPVNTGDFRTWNNQRSAVLRASQKSFPSNDITYFFTVTYFLHSKHLIWKVFFCAKLLSHGSIEQARFRQSSVRAYLRTWNIGGCTKILCTLSYAWDSNTVYVILSICPWIFIMLWSKQAKS